MLCTRRVPSDGGLAHERDGERREFAVSIQALDVDAGHGAGFEGGAGAGGLGLGPFRLGNLPEEALEILHNKIRRAKVSHKDDTGTRWCVPLLVEGGQGCGGEGGKRFGCADGTAGGMGLTLEVEAKDLVRARASMRVGNSVFFKNNAPLCRVRNG